MKDRSKKRTALIGFSAMMIIAGVLLLFTAIYDSQWPGSGEVQPETQLCEITANPFPTLDPNEPWFNITRPNIKIGQVCSFEGQVISGQIYKHQVTENLVFCLIPDDFFSGEVTGWKMKISNTMENDCGYNFGSIINPPYHGNLLFDIHGWQFRNIDNTGKNDGSVNAPQKERQFSFLLNENDFHTAVTNYSCRLWLSDCYIDYYIDHTDTSELPRSVAVFTITNLKLGNLIPNQKAWIERMSFEVKVYLPSN